MNDEEAAQTESNLLRSGWVCHIDKCGPIWVATWRNEDSSRFGLFGVTIWRPGLTLKQANRWAMSRAVALDPAFNEFVDGLGK